MHWKCIWGILFLRCPLIVLFEIHLYVSKGISANQIASFLENLNSIQLTNTDLKIRLDRAYIVQKLKPAKYCGGHIGRTQNTDIPTRPNQTETFVEIYQ